MADVSVLMRIQNGFNRGINVGDNTLVATSVKVGGNVSNTELTKAILDNLINLQNATDFGTGVNAHTHDARYFQKTELQDAVGPSTGSDLIGDDNTYVNFTPTAATVKGALAGIDAQLSASGGANTSLSNLITTSINQDLLPDATANNRYIGSLTNIWNTVIAGEHKGQTFTIVEGGFTETGYINGDSDDADVVIKQTAATANTFGIRVTTVNDVSSRQIKIDTGESTTGTSGAVTVRSGHATDTGGNSGFISVSSGQVEDGSSGSVSLASGGASVMAGISGAVTVASGNTVDGLSGTTTIRSGSVTAGTANSGDVEIITGTSFGGTRGTINLKSDIVNFFDNSDTNFSLYSHPWWGDTIPTFLYDSAAQTNGAIAITTTDLSTSFETGSILLKIGDSTGLTGHPGAVYISGGSVTNAGSSETAGHVNIEGGSSSGSGNGGSLDIRGGNSATGLGGGVDIYTGFGSSRGKISLQDGTEGTVGHVWTSIDAGGRGAWQAASGGANTSLSNLATVSFNSDLLPNANNARNIGSQTLQINTIWVESITKDGFLSVASRDITSGGTGSGQLGLRSGTVSGSGTGLTGPVDIQSGNIGNAASTADTGNVTLTSGTTTSANAASQSGNTIISSGAANAGPSGNVTVQSGNSTSNASGNLLLTTGTAGTTRGEIRLQANEIKFTDSLYIKFTESSPNWWTSASPGLEFLSGVGENDYVISTSDLATAVNTADIAIVTGSNSSASGSKSGDLFLISGQITNAGSSAQSGGVVLYTGDNAGSNKSGDIEIYTGAAVNDTGRIAIETSDSTSGDSGPIQFRTGSAPGGIRGKLRFMDGSEGTAGYVWTSVDTLGHGTWMPAAGSGANTSLSNLTTTSINEDLLPDATANFRKIGISTQRWGEVQSSNLLNETGPLGIYSLSGTTIDSDDAIVIAPVEHLYLSPAAGKRTVFGTTDTNPDNHPIFIQKDYVDVNYWGDEVPSIIAPSTFPNNSSAFHIATGDLNEIATSTHDMSLTTGHNEAITSAGKRTGDLYLATGVINDNTGAGNTGAIFLVSGYNQGTGSTGIVRLSSGEGNGSGNTGSITTESGPAGGNSGDAILRSGNAGGNSGNVLISAGSAVGTRGEIRLQANDIFFTDNLSIKITESSANWWSTFSPGIQFSSALNPVDYVVNTSDAVTDVATASLVLVTGSNGVASSTQPTGASYLVTGQISSATATGQTGEIQLYTGDNAGAGVSGNVGIYTGLAANGNSGLITLATGAAANGSSGNILIQTDNNVTTRGDIQLNARQVQFDQSLFYQKDYVDGYWVTAQPAFVVDSSVPNDNGNFHLGTTDLANGDTTHSVTIMSGVNSGTGASGLMQFASGYVTAGSGNSGILEIFSGDVVDGVSGPVNISTGLASGSGSRSAIGLSADRVIVYKENGAESLYFKAEFNDTSYWSAVLPAIVANSLVPNAANAFAILTSHVVTDVKTHDLSVSTGNNDSTTTAGQKTGTLYLESGYLTDGAGNSGEFWAGTGRSVDGTSGATRLYTGPSVGSGNSGLMGLYTGDAAAGNSGHASWKTGNTVNGTTGNINIFTGTASTTGNTGGATLESGGNDGSGNSGTVQVFSGYASASGVSGPVNIFSGETVSGATGLVSVKSGFSTSGGTTGNLVLETGTTSGTRGSIEMTASVINTNSTPIRELPLATPDLTTDAVSVDYVYQRVGHWKRYRVNYTYFTAAALTETKNLFTLGAAESIDEVVVKHAAAVSGPSISNASIEVGKTGTNNAYAASTEVFSAASGTGFGRFRTDVIESFDSTTQVTVTLTTAGANVNVATTGAIDIWVKIVNIGLNLAATATLS